MVGCSLTNTKLAICRNRKQNMPATPARAQRETYTTPTFDRSKGNLPTYVHACSWTTEERVNSKHCSKILTVFPHPCSNLGVRPVWDIRTVSFTSALQTSKVMLTIQLGCWLAWTGVYWGQNQNVSQCLLILTCLQPIAVFMKVAETFGHGQCAT